MVGEADIRITYDKYIHETTALVSSDVNYNLLVAWHDIQFINVLSPNFPACVSATMSESVKEEIVGEFPEVFRDTLTEKPMRVPEIELRENAVPYCITNPRQVPLRYQDSVSKMLDDLVSSKIIAKETRPAECCLPAFFVPKPDGAKVRLFKDYTKLNKYAKRPVHPFPSVDDIVQSIPAGSKFFTNWMLFMETSNYLWKVNHLSSPLSSLPLEDADI